jgi:hypothetical protein
VVTARYALLDGSTVVNLIRWDGNTSTYNPAPLVAVPYDPAIHTIAVDPTVINRADLIAKVQAALDTNATFLALASPTNAQTLAQVQRLTRETNALIRFVLNAFDDTTGT